MKLDCIITAVNENLLYLDFIPIFIKTWNKLYPDVDVKIILIAENIPEKFLLYKKNLIIFKPINNISTAFIAQYIRILYPAILNYKNGVMITDIDMMPMNKDYFTQNIEQYDNNKWINLRDKKSDDMIHITYQVALPCIWSEVFDVKNINDINRILINKYKIIKYNEGQFDNGWFTDQLDLYKYVMAWNKKTLNYIYLCDDNTGFNRLDRGFNINDTNIIKKINLGNYSDYHCYRPMSKYSDINWKIYDIV